MKPNLTEFFRVSQCLPIETCKTCSWHFRCSRLKKPHYWQVVVSLCGIAPLLLSPSSMSQKRSRKKDDLLINVMDIWHGCRTSEFFEMENEDEEKNLMESTSFADLIRKLLSIPEVSSLEIKNYSP